MAKDYAKAFYNSGAWKRTRRSFISKREGIDGGLCQACKSKRGYIVDHIEEITPENINDPKITLSHSNFQYLCLECHNTKTFKTTQATREGLSFTPDGDILPLVSPEI